MRAISKILLALIVCSQSHAAIYGDDNRVNLVDAPLDVQALGESVFGIVQNHRLKVTDDGYSIRKLKTGLCSDEKFRDQFVLPNCTAFLVGPKTMLTAGHCVDQENFCESNTFIMDYNLHNSENDFIPFSQTLKCSYVEKYSSEKDLDFAVIRFAEKVKRVPLATRLNGAIGAGDEVFVIGHPLGLPLKYADNGFVFDNSFEHYFKTDLDTFSGNSGSPVFNRNTGLVEGILVAGADDVEYDPRKGCGVVFKTPEVKKNGFNGEAVTRILSVDF